MRNIKQNLRRLFAWVLVIALVWSGFDSSVLAVADEDNAAILSSTEISDEIQEQTSEVGEEQLESNLSEEETTDILSDTDTAEETSETSTSLQDEAQTNETAVEDVETETKTETEIETQTQQDDTVQSLEETETITTEEEPSAQFFSAAPISLEIENNTLEISTLEQLEEFREAVDQGNNYSGVTVKLTADIDMSSLERWVPIGIQESKKGFSGIFDGGGHTVSGVKDAVQGYNGMGLFGYLSGGTVCNLHVEGDLTKGLAYISSSGYGGIVGWNDGGTVENCSFSGSVSGPNVGGIVGYNNGGTVSNCINSGSVYSNRDSRAGGIVGYNNGGAVINSANSGSVYVTATTSGTSFYWPVAGGVVGVNYNNSTIENCSNVGSVTINADAGVTGTSEGGVAGYSYGTIINCYYLSTTADIGIDSPFWNTSNDGEATSKTLDEYKSGEVANLLQGSQKSLVWGQTLGTDDYPFLTNEESKQVYKVTFDYAAEGTEDVVMYVNSGDTVSLPDGSGFHASTGMITQWVTADGETITAKTQVTENITLTEKNVFFIEGKGTQDEPYLIPDLTTLEYFRDYVNAGSICFGKYFKMTADIDMSETYSENGESWTPIGNSGSGTPRRFSGSFDGDGHTVSGLYIKSNSGYQGLFGFLSGGTIENLNVSGAVSGSNMVGGIVGSNENGTITNCYNTGTVSSGGYAGGIVGYDENGTITNCYNVATVSGGDGYTAVGGIVGRSGNGTITNCYNIATVNGSTSDSDVGGIVGYNSSTITNCYYLDTVTSTGIGYGDSGEAISKTKEKFQSGEVANLLQGSQESLVWGQTLGTDDYPVLTNEGSRQVYKVTFDYAAEDTVDIVKYVNSGETVALPELSGDAGFDASTGNINQWVTEDGEEVTADIKVTKNITLKEQGGFFAEGKGTQDEPYLIPDLTTLEYFRDYVNAGNTCADKDFKVTADIDMSKTYSKSGESWTPIGNYSSDNSLVFSGNFDGDGHTISGLYIKSSSDYQGLFGRLSNGTVENLNVSGTVSGSEYVGSIAGYNYYGTITNSYNTGAVSGTYDVGGIVGYNNGTIINSYNTGAVRGSNMMVGGIVGINYGTITNSYNTGAVSGTYDVGGIVGINYGTITNSYNTAKVSGSSMVGGIVGYNNGTITNSYYLNTVLSIGIGFGDSGEAISKTKEQFQSGEVANLLQGSQESPVWGQTLGTDDFPVLTDEESRQVYKVTFDYAAEDAEDIVKYVNSGETVTLSELSDDSGFDASTGNINQWLTEDGEEVTADIKVTKNITLKEQSGFFAEGKGTQDEPYLIPDLTTLEYFRDYVNAGNTCADKYFKVTADIDMSETYSESGESWTPIGNYGSDSSLVFSGNFDGGEYTISGLYIKSSSNYQGLFGYLSGGTVKNLSVSGAVSGNNYVGGIAGYNNNGTITNCYNTSTVSGSGMWVGGIVGNNYNGIITNCYNTGAVSDSVSSIGGIAGYNENGTITNCYNTGAVSSSSSSISGAGGIAGFNKTGTITNCYNIGIVSGGLGSWISSGIVVHNQGTITNCYYLDTVASTGIGSIGFGGTGEAISKTKEQFQSGEVSYLLQGDQEGNIWGQTLDVDDYPILTSEESKRVYQVTFDYVAKDAKDVVVYANSGDTVSLPGGVGFDASTGIITQWMTEDGETLTADIKVTENITLTGQSDFFAKGKGTQDEPYLIPDLTTLEYFRDYVNAGNICFGKYFKMTADIDMSETYSENGKSWTPIGNYGSGTSRVFGGIFDGDGHTVSGLYIKSNLDYQGLFGCLREGTVENLNVSGAVSGRNLVGGITGLNSNGTITNCNNIATVSGSDPVGGIVGRNENGTISNCYNTGAVSGSGSSIAGGIAGRNENGTISNCYNTGAVSGRGNVGGITGYDENGTISNCYNTGSSSGGGASSNRVGGIVGSSYNGSITNCYNVATVSGGDGYSAVGGIMGSGYNGSITNCYNIATVSASTSYSNVGGIVGDNSSTITNCYYLDTATKTGIGSGSGEAISKTKEQFQSGEVTYLLQGEQEDNIWGQKLDTDDYPILTDEENKKVYKVTFDYAKEGAEDVVMYANYGGTVTPPELSDGTWMLNDAAFTDSTKVTADITVTAVYGQQDIVSVNITWGALEYTYTDGIWKTDTHTYEGGGWTANTDGGDAITVENKGDVDVTVSYQYDQDIASISGSFADEQNNSIASPVALPVGEEKKSYLVLTGKPASDFKSGTLGTVTVTLGEESGN